MVNMKYSIVFDSIVDFSREAVLIRNLMNSDKNQSVYINSKCV